MNLRHLQTMKKQISVSYLGETLDVTYRINAITPDMISGVSKNNVFEALVDQVVAIIDSWDVLDEQGKAIPVSREFARTLPVAFLNAVLSAALSDTETSVEKKD